MLRNSKLIIGIILIAIGVGCITYGAYNKYSATSKMSTVLNNSSNEIENIDSLLDGNMDIETVTQNYSVIEIPDLKVKAPITDGITKENLAYSVGRFPSSPKLSEGGNISLAGHSSSIYTCVFNNIDTLTYGDKLIIYDENGKMYNYSLVNTEIVLPTEVSVLKNYGDNRLTIVTCTDNGTKRLILTFKVLSEETRLNLVKKSASERINYTNGVLEDYASSLSELSYVYNKAQYNSKIKYDIGVSETSYNTNSYVEGLLKNYINEEGQE